MRQFDGEYAWDAVRNTLKMHPSGLHENRTFGEVLVQRRTSPKSLDLSHAHNDPHQYSRISQVNGTLAGAPLGYPTAETANRFDARLIRHPVQVATPDLGHRPICEPERFDDPPIQLGLPVLERAHRVPEQGRPRLSKSAASPLSTRSHPSANVTDGGQRGVLRIIAELYLTTPSEMSR